MTSHVRLSYVYKLVVYAERKLRELKYLIRPMITLLKIPTFSDKAFAQVYAKVMDGIPLLLLYSEKVLKVPTEKSLGIMEAVELGVARQRRGLLQLIVKIPTKVELSIPRRALALSEFLRFLQRSLSKSILVSSLLSGVLLTIALSS